MGALGGAILVMIVLQAHAPGATIGATFQAERYLFIALAANGCAVGVVTTRWCWQWAVGNQHPLLARLETALPLRGQWLVLAMAAFLFPLHWGAFMTLLILLCAPTFPFPALLVVLLELFVRIRQQRGKA